MQYRDWLKNPSSLITGIFTNNTLQYQDPNIFKDWEFFWLPGPFSETIYPNNQGITVVAIFQAICWLRRHTNQIILTSDGGPWVAQRVWAIPTWTWCVPSRSRLSAWVLISSSRALTLPFFFTKTILSSDSPPSMPIPNWKNNIKEH